MPLGIMNAPCKVTVTKETSQTAAHPRPQRAEDDGAHAGQSFRRSVWLINQDVVPQMKLGWRWT
jgi:hypothetical protein